MSSHQSKKCIIKDCDNYEYDPKHPELCDAHGEFTGDICSPCHIFITTGTGTDSQAYRNALTTAASRLIADTTARPWRD